MSKPTINLQGMLTEKPVPAQPSEAARPKSLSLKVDTTTYKRLRQFSLDHDMSHQDILERALTEFLDRN